MTLSKSLGFSSPQFPYLFISREEILWFLFRIKWAQSVLDSILSHQRQKKPLRGKRDCYTTATAKLAPRVWGLQPPAEVSPWLRSPRGGVNHQVFLATCAPIRAAPGSQWGCPPSYAATHLAFEGVSLGLWWAQQHHLKGTIPLFDSTGASAGAGVHWAFPAVTAPYPTGQGTSEHLASCWVHPDGALGDWGCNRQARGPFWALLVRAGSDPLISWPSEVLTLMGVLWDS